MTDEQMDARLRRAGAAWRASNDSVAAVSAVDTVPLDTEPLPLVAPVRRRRLPRTGLLASAAVVAAALVAGGAVLIANIGGNGKQPTEVGQPANRLVGTNWVLVRITDAHGTNVPVAGNPRLLIDTSHQLSGTDGCNAVSGKVDVTGSTIGVGSGLSITAMGCLDPQVGATATRVDAMLSGDISWRISGDELTLTKDGAGTLVYRATPGTSRSTDPADLTGKRWYLTTIETGTGPDTTAHSVTGRLRLEVGDKLLFDDGCNFDTASVTTGDGTLDIGSVGGTLVGCTGPLEMQTNEILAVLTGHVTWAITGDQLTITKDGVGALVYQAAASQPLTGPGSTDWILTSIKQSSGSITSADLRNDRISLADEGHITISHRCYVDTGDVRFGDQSLDISNVQLKKAIPCPATPEQQQEQQHTAAMDDVLAGHATWAMDTNGLSITKNGTTLTFTSASSGPSELPASATATDVVSPDALIGTSWKLTSIEVVTGNSASGSGSSDTRVALSFDGRGGYRLATGCFGYAGKAAVSGTAIAFSDQRSLGGLACRNTMGDQARKLLASGTGTWSIDNGQLRLVKDGTTLTFAG